MSSMKKPHPQRLPTTVLILQIRPLSLAPVGVVFDDKQIGTPRDGLAVQRTIRLPRSIDIAGGIAGD